MISSILITDKVYFGDQLSRSTCTSRTLLKMPFNHEVFELNAACQIRWFRFERLARDCWSALHSFGPAFKGLWYAVRLQ